MKRREFIKAAVMAAGALGLSGIAEAASGAKKGTHSASYASSSNNSKGGKSPGKRVLVAYFSASGVTAGVASRLSAALNADLREIIPEKTYTEEDLNWRDKKSRSSVEMADRNSRPAIQKSSLGAVSAYDVIFIGFPIWWYREPSIIDTFMTSLDFSGRTVVPFATSGSSGMGDSSKNLQKLAPAARVLEGRRFSADVPAKELTDWASPIISEAPAAASTATAAATSAEAAAAAAAASTVYFTREITPDALVKIFSKLNGELGPENSLLKRKVAVKISTGEGGNNHYLHPELIGKLVQNTLHADIVECNTARAWKPKTTGKPSPTMVSPKSPKWSSWTSSKKRKFQRPQAPFT